MSTPRTSARPPARRPLSKGVYWRRRAMVGGTAVLLVIAGVDLVNGDGSGPSETATQVVATPTADPGASSTASPGKGRKKRKNKPGQSATPTPTPTPPAPTYTPPPEPPPAEPEGTCADDDILVTPVMEPALAGQAVLVTLALRTREAEACTWTVSRSHLAYKITDADGDDVWSSSQCPAQVPTDDIVVRRALTATYRLAWNGRSSSLDCPRSMSLVDPGDYAVQAAAIGGEPSAVVPFELTDPDDVVDQGPIGPPLPETATPGKADKNKNKSKNQPADR